MQTPKLKADLDNGQGYVSFPDQFRAESRLVKLDMLKDWIRRLQREYDRTLDQKETI